MSKPGTGLLVIALCLALAVQVANAKIYAVVVGIDRYAHANDLAGAVNDARDLAQALDGIGAELTLLLDEAATREAILSAFRSYAAQAEPGDSLVLTYAGHGMQEPEALPGDESDGRDEVFVLGGFDSSGPAAAERIRDNEIAALFAEVPKEIEILFVADSCHSGTMTRNLDPRGRQAATRLADFGTITDDPLEAPPAETFQKEATHLPNVVFAASALDSEQTPEVLIGEEWRGALSWSLARAIEGYGRSGAQALALRDLRSYLRTMVRALSEARQTPDLVFRAPPATDDSSRVLTLGLPPGESRPSVADFLPAPEPTDRPPRLVVTGSALEQPLDAEDASIVDEPEAADLIWDRPRGELIDRLTADLIAEVADREVLLTAIRKWRAVKRLAGWVARRPLEVLLEPGDGRHVLGSEISIVINRPWDSAPAHVTIFNLASNGLIQPVFPDKQSVAQNADLMPSGQPSARFGPSRIVEPVGADHIVVVISRRRLGQLHAVLETAGDNFADLAFEARLRAMVSEDEANVGLLPIFSARPAP